MKAIIRTAVAAVICIAAFAVPNASAQLSSGIWIDKDELRSLPTSGAAWTSLKAAADRSCGTPDLENQDDPANVCVMAQALVYARTGTASYADRVVTALTAVVNSGAYGGRALALGRELAAYVIAADLIDLETYDPGLDQSFRAKIRSLSTTTTTEAGTLAQCHENRPNNWGTHCGASRAAVAAYLGDTAQLARVAQVFKGWLGDRSSYAGFTYGDLSWQYSSAAPVGVNPTGAAKSGHDIDGVLPDDQRRAGGFTWPPPKENYVWEALQGAFAQAVILDRAGYDVFNWQDQALLRAVTWLHEQADFPAANDDTWIPHLANYFYGASFPAPAPSSPGKNVGWTDWTHSGAASSCSFSLSPASATLPAAGGGTQATVTTTSGCSWTARSNVSWITLNSAGGTGNGTVIATVAANTTASTRTGTLTIAGRTFTVTQQGGSCTYTLSASSASVAASGGSGSVGVTASGAGCAWTATSGAAWATVSPASGSGSATVSYAAAANTGAARSAALTIAGRTFTLNQAAATAPPATPTAPASPTPSSGATSVATTTTLRWTCSGASSYTVRLGTANPPAQVATGVATTSYTPATLSAGRTYYWQVVGVGSGGSTAGPVWSFSTAASTVPPPTALPSPWTSGDIGSVGLAGSAGYAAGVFTVTGSGAGIAGSADAFRLVQRPLTGHSSITARLTSLQASDAGAQAGIMMREGRGGVAAGSAHATLVVRRDGSVVFLSRSSTGGTTRTVATTTQGMPVWLRLARTSTTVTASISTNGSTWRTVGSVSLALTSKSVVGLAVASHGTTLRNTSTFDNVSVP
ncbi:MAG: hypothetical protein H6Q10_820 [Acidobacteria bacterium]|nr:hypothetical protein [Acidobacteriota bacterium]